MQICQVHSKCKLGSFTETHLRIPFKDFTSDKLQIVVFKEFQVALKVSSFVGNLVHLVYFEVEPF